MDTDITLDKKIDDALTSTPEEVKNFIESRAYAIILEGVAKFLNLDDKQKDSLKGYSLLFLLHLKNPEEIFEELTGSGTEKELAAKIVYLLVTQIGERAATISEFSLEEDNTPEVDNSPAEINAPTPTDVLATLAERLEKSKVVTPTTNNYTNRSESEPKKFDPYRETPEI